MHSPWGQLLCAAGWEEEGQNGHSLLSGDKRGKRKKARTRTNFNTVDDHRTITNRCSVSLRDGQPSIAPTALGCAGPNSDRCACVREGCCVSGPIGASAPPPPSLQHADTHSGFWEGEEKNTRSVRGEEAHRLPLILGGRR